MPKKRRKPATRIKPGVKYIQSPIGKWVPAASPLPAAAGAPASPSTQNPAPGGSVTRQHIPNLLLKWPLDPGFIITQNFQQHIQTKIDMGYKYYNGGLDLAYFDVREGAHVYSAAPGIVKYARFSCQGYGNYVHIDHFDGFSTIYAHLSQINCIAVNGLEGESLSVGSLIGYLGHTGNCWGGPGNPEGTHLHFELRYKNTPIDPMPFMSGVSPDMEGAS